MQSLLGQLGLENCGLCRFEENMLKDSGAYYSLLAYTEQTGNYTPLVRYVTESVLSAYRDAVEVFSEKDKLKDMDENMRHLARMAKERGSFSLRDASHWISLGDVALRKDLDELVEMGVLGKEGKTRALRYVFLDPFRDIGNRQ